jgi:ribonuclease J
MIIKKTEKIIARRDERSPKPQQIKRKPMANLGPNEGLRITPLGGCGEIGMNMTVFQIDNHNYIVDCGALFPDATLPGVDLILPEVSWLTQQNFQLEAWLITHGHEDHIGALPHIYPKFPAPIYGSEFTLELIRGKLEEAGIKNVQYKLWIPDKTVAFRGLKLTPYRVNHSIVDALGFFIETKYGNILHTGDFRIDYNPPEQSMTHENIKTVIGQKPVHIMMSDSTNSFSKGSDKSENDLVHSFEDLMRKDVTTFASNVWRYKSIVEAAQKCGKKVFFFGRSMLKNYEIATKLGILKLTRDVVLSEDELKGFPKSKLVVVCTGSQGEVFSGASRLAFGTFHNVKLDANDAVVFSARAIPGNEKSIGALINQFTRLGCEVLTSKEVDCHVSGHGYQEDLLTVLRTAKPRHFMPVHGEYRHLKKHIELATKTGVSLENCHLVENGSLLHITDEFTEIATQIQSGRDYVCQGGVFNESGDVYKTRLNVAKHGLICVNFVMKERGYDLACSPSILNRGVPLDEQKFAAGLAKIYGQSLHALSTALVDKPTKQKGSVNLEALKEEIRLQLRRALEKKINYKCSVAVTISRVGS